MLAAVVVMYYKWRLEVDVNSTLVSDLENTQRARDIVRAENERLRNDLHAAINARKAKSRGKLGRLREAVESAIAALEPELADSDILIDVHNNLRDALDSEAPNA